MDILTMLNPTTAYTTPQLQLILGAWVIKTGFFGDNQKISPTNGDIAEGDYTKQSLYALLYSLYRTIGTVKDQAGTPYEFTFNTWGYTWPNELGDCPNSATDPQRFGRNAYSGLYAFPLVQDYIGQRDGSIHIVEMGCGTGAGAHHVCTNVFPKCTYQAFDLQQAGIDTCNRKYVPTLNGRLIAERTDCSTMSIGSEIADIAAVCETHVAEMCGYLTDEDQRFFRNAQRILKPGGLFVWGTALPDTTWNPACEFLNANGMKVIEVRDVTREAIAARDQDAARVEIYVDKCLDKFLAFRIPWVGSKKRAEAEVGLKNFFRHPGTHLYNTMVERNHSYRVVLAQKV